jgi:trehalose 6-phosphate phosphatase
LQVAKTASALETLLQRITTGPSSLLLLDYDGTLAPFHADRSLAYPYAGVISILQRMVRSGRTRVIILSGRPIVELRALLAPLESLEMWGSHGMEHQSSDGGYIRCQVGKKDAASLEEAEKRVATAGLLSRVEIKLGGIAVHWRGLPAFEAMRVESLARQGWTSLAERSGLKLLHFEAGLELRVPSPNKGDAVRSVIAGLDPNVPIACLGDDLTDEDAFRALGRRGLSVLVKADERETIAEARIRPPEELIDFLERWLNSTPS